MTVCASALALVISNFVSLPVSAITFILNMVLLVITSLWDWLLDMEQIISEVFKAFEYGIQI